MVMMMMMMMMTIMILIIIVIIRMIVMTVMMRMILIVVLTMMMIMVRTTTITTTITTQLNPSAQFNTNGILTDLCTFVCAMIYYFCRDNKVFLIPKMHYTHICVDVHQHSCY